MTELSQVKMKGGPAQYAEVIRLMLMQRLNLRQIHLKPLV